MAAAAFSGSYVGTVLALPLSGVLAQHVGWEWIFYVFGAIGISENNLTLTQFDLILAQLDGRTT